MVVTSPISACISCMPTSAEAHLAREASEAICSHPGKWQHASRQSLICDIRSCDGEMRSSGATIYQIKPPTPLNQTRHASVIREHGTDRSIKDLRTSPSVHVPSLRRLILLQIRALCLGKPLHRETLSCLRNSTPREHLHVKHRDSMLKRTDTTTWATGILKPTPELLNGKDGGLCAGAR